MLLSTGIYYFFYRTFNNVYRKGVEIIYPSIYSTGTTIYNPDKCFIGYTVFQAKELGALMIDMYGGEAKLWKGLHGFPNKLLKGGQIVGHTGERSTKFSMQDYRDLVQVDWKGNIIWQFNEYEYIEDPGEDAQWMSKVSGSKGQVRKDHDLKSV